MNNHPLVRQANIIMLCAFILAGAACAGLTVQQKVDAGIQVATQVYTLADAYYQANKPIISAENQVLFEKYLAGFKLALTTGTDVAAYCLRWYQFLQGY